MPKIVDATEQRREIRDAALRVFARRGVAGTGLAQVAEAAGMGRSSLYHYYPDKGSLVRDLLRSTLEEEEALFEAAACGRGSPLTRIEALVGSLADTFGDWLKVGRALFELRSSAARQFQPFFRRIRATLAELIAEGQEAGEASAELDPELAAALLIGAVDGLLIQYFLDPRAFPDRAALRDALLVNTRRVLAA